MIKLIGSVFLILSLSVFASGSSKNEQDMFTRLHQQGMKLFQSANVDDQDWELLVVQHRGEQVLSIYERDSKKIIFRYAQQGLSVGFLRLQWLNLKGQRLLATVWQRGVHGEKFMLFEPRERKTLYQVTSSWPLSFNVCQGDLLITVNQQGISPDTPRTETHVWHQPGYVEIRQDQGPPCKMPERIAPRARELKPVSLNQFLKQFDQAVAAKNMQAVEKILAGDILNNYSGEGGKKEFRSIWKQQADTLFKELAAMRKGGGVLSRDLQGRNLYCMPRMAFDFPKSIDVFTHGVIYGSNIAVHLKANNQSPVLTRLSWDIVRVVNWQDKSWQVIELKQGVRGFVRRTNVRSPVDYRACFLQGKDNRWRMSSLVAGD